MSRRKSGDIPQDSIPSEKDGTSTSTSSPSMSEANDSSRMSAESEDSPLPTPGTEETEPQIIITFGKQGVRFTMSDDVHKLNMVALERATFLLRREVMKARRRMAHQSPAERTAGWDNSYEKDKEVKNVAA